MLEDDNAQIAHRDRQEAICRAHSNDVPLSWKFERRDAHAVRAEEYEPITVDLEPAECRQRHLLGFSALATNTDDHEPPT